MKIEAKLSLESKYVHSARVAIYSAKHRTPAPYRFGPYYVIGSVPVSRVIGMGFYFFGVNVTLSRH